MNAMTRTSFAIALGLCAFVGRAYAVDVYVGQGPFCDAPSLFDALNIVSVSGPGPHTIHATNEIFYADQALYFGASELTIVGEHGCDDPTPEVAVINGDGQHSVMTISGTNNATVILRNLVIRGGGNDGTGGGLDIRGQVNVTLDGTIVRDNLSDYGGGVYLENGAGSSSGILLMLPGSSIRNNFANQLGGGVYAPGGRVRMHADNTSVRGNTSLDGGGGLALFGGSLSTGKYVDSAIDGTASGAVVEDNHAGTVGGGIYLYGATAGLYAYELIVQNNRAELVGGGIAAAAGALLSMQRDYPNAPSTFNCPNSAECSRISDNSVAGGAPNTRGGAIALYTGARAYIAQTIVRNNIAADGAAAWVDGSTLNAEGVLFTLNHTYDSPSFGSTMVHAVYQTPSSPPQMRFAFVTFAGNLATTDQGTPRPASDIVAQQNTVLELYSTALYDSPYSPVTYGPYTDDCVVHSTGGGIDPHGTHTRASYSATPGFNLPDVFDYRLRSNSLLTDYCDSSAYQPTFRDLVLTPRCVDDPRKPDAYGTCDIGAYESDHIFGNGLD
jgi:hypothetical protein